MSVESIVAALHTPNLNPSHKLVLVGIANHDGDGGAWPSIDTLAMYAGVSERRVQQIIAELADVGLVVVELQAGGSATTRADRRPNLYRLHLDDGAKLAASRRSNGVKRGAPRGEAQRVDGVKPTSPEPSCEPSGETSESSSDVDAIESSTVWSLCDQLANSIEARGSKRPTVTVAWRRDMERMLRIDGRDPAKVAAMIRFLAEGRTEVARFWQPNVRSPGKLREKYDQIAERANHERGLARPAARVDEDRDGPSGRVTV